eukprot:gene25185-11009_t
MRLLQIPSLDEGNAVLTNVAMNGETCSVRMEMYA